MPPASPRIAWLFPTLRRSFYFQPLFREMARRFPGSAIFTGLWPGYLDGYEGTFEVRTLRGARLVDYAPDVEGTGTQFLWVPPSTLWTLFRFRPGVIVVGGFSIALVYATLLKLVLGCRILLLWDGNAPFATFGRDTWRGRLRRLQARAIDAGVSNTGTGTQYLRDDIGIARNRCSACIYQVPDMPAMTSRRADLSALPTDDAVVFLYAGRLVSVKGLHQMLRAAALLRGDGIQGFRIVVVGSGPEEVSYRALADELGLGDCVHWMGERPYGEIGSLFEACDVFVMPSIVELRGMVVSEAMAFGKPVLVTKNADLADIVFDGDNGFLFDPNDPRQLADLMARFIASAELRARCGARSREIAEPITAEAAAEHLGAVVREICGAVA